MAVYYLCSGFGMKHSFVNKFGALLTEDLKTRKNLVDSKKKVWKATTEGYELMEEYVR